MTEKVPAREIESIVGIKRHPTAHSGRAVDGMFYILHSQTCLDDFKDLRKCPFSLALDKSVRFETEDAPQLLAFGSEGLIAYDFPVGVSHPSH